MSETTVKISFHSEIGLTKSCMRFDVSKNGNNSSVGIWLKKGQTLPSDYRIGKAIRKLLGMNP